MLSYIQKSLELPEKAIANTLKLLEEDATVPFISRYRKEMTGNLDEVQIQAIANKMKEFEALEKRKETICKAIDEQGLLNEDLRQKIKGCMGLVQLEDLYLPYKKKRKTKATVAREKGLEPLAKILMAQRHTDVEIAAHGFLNDAVPNEDEALAGARDIVAEWVNENQKVRNQLRKIYGRQAQMVSKVVAAKKDSPEAQKYQQYFDWEENLSRCPSHRLLAMLRAEKEGYCKLKVQVDEDRALDTIDDIIIKGHNKSTEDQLLLANKDAFKRLLASALANEVLKEAKQKADTKAISVFSENLRQLLLGAPLGTKRILALDPGFKSGCKLVCLDANGGLEHNETIYPHPPQRQSAQAAKKIRSLVNAHKIEAIAIGNGTASRETEQFIKTIGFDRDLEVFVVNEAGASVYSASSLARKEFPNYDVTVRGAISIGRRLADPLAELVKIDPKSIGVGQYQHDVDQTQLKEELDQTVSSCVNAVGINLNTASSHLLTYVSGIGATLAQNIVAYRKENNGFSSRKELLKVPRLGAKAYEQAAGFIRVKGAKNPLDDSAVHPERYDLVNRMAKDLQMPLQDLVANTTAIKRINKQQYLTQEVGLPTLNDILKELEKPGLDPREKAKVFAFDPNLKTIADLKVGMKVPGLVNNITAFGCFVDIGIKESGLIHISKLKAGYVSDVNEVVKLNQTLQVTVLAVDLDRKRIQLSLVD
ncbi:Tex family protein [Sediminicola luteus]|uniref:RNA-binding transcriptional accessory protein n=1 Tax=Sediminicola luteus TaxID=319238 RepID=A0A2A4GEM7_9FLAO|nr:Tex family protein [Sediminicola luteus]PCE66458.1 RNA-binding transcriptional accessory protein [Sediminicola luteus]